MRQAPTATRRVDRYDTARYPFAEAVAALLDVPDLARLHETMPPGEGTHGDQDTPAHRAFYAGFDAAVRPLYEEYLVREVLPLGGEDLCVQAMPTFRVHYPGLTAVREYHRDSDYFHQSGVLNYWVPLTRAAATSTVWLETAVGTAAYEPVDLEPGQLLCFDAVALRHGNQPNVTGATRVSFDFRVIPRRRYRPNGRRTVTNNTRLELGAYFMLLASDGSFDHRSAADAGERS
jgi:hypothetical protein